MNLTRFSGFVRKQNSNFYLLRHKNNYLHLKAIYSAFFLPKLGASKN